MFEMKTMCVRMRERKSVCKREIECVSVRVCDWMCMRKCVCVYDWQYVYMCVCLIVWVCVCVCVRDRWRKRMRKREWGHEGAALSLVSAWGYDKKPTNDFFLKERERDWFQHPQIPWQIIFLFTINNLKFCYNLLDQIFIFKQSKY